VSVNESRGGGVETNWVFMCVK